VAALAAAFTMMVGCWVGENTVTMWLENDTQQVLRLDVHGGSVTLLPGEALDVETVASPGVDRFTGEMDGVEFEIVIDTGEISQYEDPVGSNEYRIPISKFIR
jgi:hypothetical protein